MMKLYYSQSESKHKVYYTTSNLQRTEPTLFKYTKQGIVLKHPREEINLSYLFKTNPSLVWGYLDSLGEQELTKCQREDLEDVIEEFIKNNI